MARDQLPITHDALLHQYHNVVLRLLYESSFGPRSNLSLTPLG